LAVALSTTPLAFHFSLAFHISPLAFHFSPLAFVFSQLVGSLKAMTHREM
jgi:hypothetical protein